MTVIAGVTSAGIMLAFVYSQGPIVARVSMVENGQKIGLTVADDTAMSGEYIVAGDGSIALKGKQDIGPIKVGGMTAKAASDTIAEKLGLVQSDADPKVSVDARNIMAILPVQAVGLFGGALLNVIYPAYLMTRTKIVGRVVAELEGMQLGGHHRHSNVHCRGVGQQGHVAARRAGASVGAGIQQAMQMVGGQGLGFISGEWRGVHGKPRQQMYLAIVFLIVAAIIMAYSNTLK